MQKGCFVLFNCRGFIVHLSFINFFSMTLTISFCKWSFYWLSVFDKVFFNEFLSEKCINVVYDVSVAVFDIKGTENGGDYEI